MKLERIYRGAQASCACVVLLLAACGGSGNGGGGSGLSLSVSTTSITFTAIQNGVQPTPQQVNVSISGGSVFVGISSVTGPLSAMFAITGNTTGTITIAASPPVMAPGTYTGTVTVRGCPDFSCTGGDVAGSPKVINVSYTIQPQQGLSANPQSLGFNQLQGAPAPTPQSVDIADLQGGSYAWSASAIYQSGSGWLNLNGASTASGTTLPASLSLSVNSTLALGTLNALIHVTGNGHALDVPVSYTVTEPQLTRSPAQLTFNASTQGVSPANQDVTLSTQVNLPLNYTTSVTYGAGATGWLSPVPSGQAPGTVSVGVNTTDLAPGTYNATIAFSSAAQNVSVAVSYVVVSPALTFSPSSVGFVIDTTSLPAALVQSVSVGSTGVPLAWTAASSQPWVSVSPASGSSGSSVTLTIDQGQLATLDPGTRSATITFSYTPPRAAPTSAPVATSLDLRLPKIASVTPYVANSATSKEVILRGLGFNNAAGATLKFGASASVSSFTVTNDTEIRVTHPSLAAGTYLVTIPHQLNNPSIIRSDANLVVVDPPVYVAATIPYPNATAKQPLDIVYDPERQALLVGVAYPAPGSSGEIFRIPFTGAAWGAPISILTSSFRDFALSLDGKKVIAASDFSVQAIDAATLAPGTVTPTLVFELTFRGIAMANDGNALLTTAFPAHPQASSSVWLYSVRDAKIALLASVGFVAATPGASADGSRVVFSVGGPAGTGLGAGQYNSSTGVLSFVDTLSAQNSFRPKLDRRASRILANGSAVLDSNYSVLGNLAAASTAVAFSPDGTRAYQYVSGATLHTYDLTAAPVSGFFPEIFGGTPLPSDPGANSVMTVSPDGGTLFIAGSDAIVVVPAP